MKYGYFDKENREYVIIRPDTPTPWINYLGSDEYCAMISNTAGGYSFHKDPKEKRILRFRYNNIRCSRHVWAVSFLMSIQARLCVPHEGLFSFVE